MGDKQAAPPGWYPNPAAPGQRFWNGSAWTDDAEPVASTAPTGNLAPTRAPATYCRACAAPIDPRATMCTRCGVPQASTSQIGHAGLSRKEPGLAVLFSFLWPGAGNLYVNDVTTGIVAISIGIVNFLLSFTIIWLVIGIPVWLGLFIWTAIDSHNKAKSHNAQFGFA